MTVRAQPSFLQITPLLELILLLMAVLLAGAGANGQTGRADTLLMQRVDRINDSAVKTSNFNIRALFDYSKKALDLSQQIGYKDGEGQALTEIGSYYFNREKYDSALSYFFRGLDILGNTSKPELINTVYSQIIWMFLYTRSNDKAMKYLKIFKAHLDKKPSRKSLAYYTLNYGQYHMAEKQYDRALNTFYYALYLFTKTDDTLGKARIYKYLGDTYIQKKDYPRALFNYAETNKILKVHGDPPDMAIMYTRIAHVYQLMEDKDEVLKYELMALNIREKVRQVEFITLSNINVGSAYMRMNRLGEAEPYLMRGLRMANEIGKIILIESANKQLFEYMKKRGKLREAIICYRDYTDSHLQLLLDQNNSEISILDANRMMVEAETRNAMLIQMQDISKLEMRNRKMKTLGFELIFLALLICIQFFYSLYRKNSRRKGELQNLNDRLEEEIRERMLAMQDLKQSEELYRFLAEHSSDVISRLDKMHGRNYISPSCKKIYGFDAEEIIAMEGIYDLIEPEWHEEVEQQFEEMVKTKKPARFRYRARRKEMPSFWAESQVNPLFDEETGELKEMITVVRDISERMKTEEAIAENDRQKEILLHEIHNRVKNNFAVLVSLMSMQRELIPDPIFSRSIADLQLRVRTMSLVHEQLYESHGINAIPFGDYLRNLATIVANAYQNDRITMHTEIVPCDLPIETVMPLGLIVNELLTNAYKYAFPGDRTGSIHVELHHIGEQQWELMIQDDGIGLPEDFFNEKSRSMGMQIVHILVQQIEATLGIGSKNGSRFLIIFTTF